MKKIITIITLGCFIISSVAGQALASVVSAAEDAKRLDTVLKDLAVPSSAGRITDAGYFGGKQVVIDIQDLHCHAEVQKNISTIIASLDEKYRLANVYLEGAFGSVDTSWLLSLDQETRRSITEALLDQGKLTGAEYYSVSSGKPGLIRGLENEEVYRQNLARLGMILERQESAIATVRQLQAELEPLKAAYYNPSQKKFEKTVSRYREGGMDARKYYALLEKHSSKFNIDVAGYRNLSAYLRLAELAKGINYTRVAEELQEVMQVLKHRLPFRLYNELIEETDNFSRLDQVYLLLAKLSREYGLDLTRDYPYLARFLSYAEENRQINPLDLVDEEKKLEGEINFRLSENESEREVAFLVDFLRYLAGYCQNKISADEYEYILANLARFKLLWTKYVDDDGLSTLDGYLPLLNEFYQVNLERNNWFYRNVLAEDEISSAIVTQPVRYGAALVLEQLKEADEIKVVVAGGFHTPGLKKLFEEKGISYLVITPNVTKDTRLSEEVYAELAREQQKIAHQTMALIDISQHPEIDKAKAVAGVMLPLLVEQRRHWPLIEQGMNDVLRSMNKSNEIEFKMFEMNEDVHCRFFIRFGGERLAYEYKDGKLRETTSGQDAVPDRSNPVSRAKKASGLTGLGMSLLLSLTILSSIFSPSAAASSGYDWTHVPDAHVISHKDYTAVPHLTAQSQSQNEPKVVIRTMSVQEEKDIRTRLAMIIEQANKTSYAPAVKDIFFGEDARVIIEKTSQGYPGAIFRIGVNPKTGQREYLIQLNEVTVKDRILLPPLLSTLARAFEDDLRIKGKRVKNVVELHNQLVDLLVQEKEINEVERKYLKEMNRPVPKTRKDAVLESLGGQIVFIAAIVSLGLFALLAYKIPKRIRYWRENQEQKRDREQREKEKDERNRKRAEKRRAEEKKATPRAVAPSPAALPDTPAESSLSTVSPREPGSSKNGKDIVSRRNEEPVAVQNGLENISQRALEELIALSGTYNELIELIASRCTLSAETRRQMVRKWLTAPPRELTQKKYKELKRKRNGSKAAPVPAAGSPGEKAMQPDASAPGVQDILSRGTREATAADTSGDEVKAWIDRVRNSRSQKGKLTRDEQGNAKHVLLYSPDKPLLTAGRKRTLLRHIRNSEAVLIKLLEKDTVEKEAAYIRVQRRPNGYMIQTENTGVQDLKEGDYLRMENGSFIVENVERYGRLFQITIRGTGSDLPWVDQRGSFSFRIVSDMATKIQLERIRDIRETFESSGLTTTGSAVLDRVFGLRRNMVPPLAGPEEEIRYFDQQIPFREISVSQTEGDESQAMAVKLALDQAGVLFIEGPVGTGKTKVIAEIIRQTVSRGKKVLLVSQMHQAVDNALSKKASGDTDSGEESGIISIIDDPEIPVLRLGNDPANLRYGTEEVWPGNRDAGVRRDVLSKFNKRRRSDRGFVIAATDMGIATDSFYRRIERQIGGFDLVIMDESSRETMAGAVVPLSYLGQDGKVVFVGDGRQLPPFGLTDDERQYLLRSGARDEVIDEFNTSIFDHLLERGYGDLVMLSTNYRSHPLITGLISYLFYGGDLNWRDRSDSDDDIPSLNVADIAEIPGEYYERPSGTSFVNERSAQEVIRLVEWYREQGTLLGNMTVLTPYGAQRDLIISQLKEKLEGVAPLPAVTTIDSFQGGENDVVIVDFVRSNRDRKIGFIKDLRRLNVGLSRARKSLSIIWDSRTFTGEVSSQDSHEDAVARQLLERLKKYYEIATQVSSSGVAPDEDGPNSATPGGFASIGLPLTTLAWFKKLPPAARYPVSLLAHPLIGAPVWETGLLYAMYHAWGLWWAVGIFTAMHITVKWVVRAIELKERGTTWQNALGRALADPKFLVLVGKDLLISGLSYVLLSPFSNPTLDTREALATSGFLHFSYNLIFGTFKDMLPTWLRWLPELSVLQGSDNALPEDEIEFAREQYSARPEEELASRRREEGQARALQSGIAELKKQLGAVDPSNAGTKDAFLENLRAMYQSIPARINEGKTFSYYRGILKRLHQRHDAVYAAMDKAYESDHKAELEKLNREAIRLHRIILKVQILVAGMILSGKSRLVAGEMRKNAALWSLDGAVYTAAALHEELRYRLVLLAGEKYVRDTEQEDWIGRLAQAARQGKEDSIVPEIITEQEATAVTEEVKAHWINVKTRLISVRRAVKRTAKGTAKGDDIPAALKTIDALTGLYTPNDSAPGQPEYRDVAVMNQTLGILEKLTGLKALVAALSGVTPEQAKQISAAISDILENIPSPRQNIPLEVTFETPEKHFKGKIETIAGYLDEYTIVARAIADLQYYSDLLQRGRSNGALSKRNRARVLSGLGRIQEWTQRGFVFEKQLSALNLGPAISMVENNNFEGANVYLRRILGELQRRQNRIERIVERQKQIVDRTLAEYRDEDVAQRINEIVENLRNDDIEEALLHLAELQGRYFSGPFAVPKYKGYAEELGGIIKYLENRRNRTRQAVEGVIKRLGAINRDLTFIRVRVTREDGRSRELHLAPGITAFQLLQIMKRDPLKTLVKIGKNWILGNEAQGLKLTRSADIAIRHNENRSFGDIDVREEQGPEADALNKQIQKAFGTLQDAIRSDNGLLSEQEADAALVRLEKAQNNELNGYREQLREFLKGKIRGDIPAIYFVPGEKGHLWQVNGKHAAAHFSTTRNSVYLNLDFVHFLQSLLSPDAFKTALNALVLHEAVHLAGKTHRDALAEALSLSPDLFVLFEAAKTLLGQITAFLGTDKFDTDKIFGHSLRQWVNDHYLFSDMPRYYDPEGEKWASEYISRSKAWTLGYTEKYIVNFARSVGKGDETLAAVERLKKEARAAGKKQVQYLRPLLVWAIRGTHIRQERQKSGAKLFAGTLKVTAETRLQDLPIWPVDGNGNLLVDLLRWMRVERPDINGTHHIPAGAIPDREYYSARKVSIAELIKKEEATPPVQLSLFGDGTSIVAPKRSRNKGLNDLIHKSPLLFLLGLIITTSVVTACDIVNPEPKPETKVMVQTAPSPTPVPQVEPFIVDLTPFNNWIESQKIGELVQSYQILGDVELTPEELEHMKGFVNTYDQSLAVINYLNNGNIQRARAILDYFQNSGNVPTKSNKEKTISTGEATWIGIAAAQYSYHTKDFERYAPLMQRIDQHLLALAHAGGYVVGEPGVTWASTEHNLDILAYFEMRYYLSRDKEHKQLLRQAQFRIAKWLVTYAYIEEQGYFLRGVNDPIFATDTTSFGTLVLRALKTVDPSFWERSGLGTIKLDQLMKTAEKEAMTRYGATFRGDPSLKLYSLFRYEGSNPFSLPSLEVSAQMALVYRLADKTEEANATLREIYQLAINDDKGNKGIPYATGKASTFSRGGWLATPFPSIASNVFFQFAVQGLNPFELGSTTKEKVLVEDDALAIGIVQIPPEDTVITWENQWMRGDGWSSTWMDFLPSLNIDDKEELIIHIKSSTPGTKIRVQLVDIFTSVSKEKGIGAEKYELTGGQENIVVKLNSGEYSQGVNKKWIRRIVIVHGKEVFYEPLNATNTRTVAVDSIEFKPKKDVRNFSLMNRLGMAAFSGALAWMIDIFVFANPATWLIGTILLSYYMLEAALIFKTEWGMPHSERVFEKISSKRGVYYRRVVRVHPSHFLQRISLVFGKAIRGTVSPEQVVDGIIREDVELMSGLPRWLQSIVRAHARRHAYFHDLKKRLQSNNAISHRALSMVLSMPLVPGMVEEVVVSFLELFDLLALGRTRDPKTRQLEVDDNKTPIPENFQALIRFLTDIEARKQEIAKGNIKGVSHTVGYHPDVDERALAENLIKEMWRLIIYTAKGDLIPEYKGQKGLLGIPEEFWAAALNLATAYPDTARLRKDLRAMAEATRADIDEDSLRTRYAIPDASSITSLIQWVFEERLDDAALGLAIEKYFGGVRYSAPGMLFGAPFNDDVLTPLRQLIKDLRDTAAEEILYLPEPEHCHITVTFENENTSPELLPREDMAKAKKAVQEKVAGLHPFEASLSGDLQLMPDGAIILKITDPAMVQGIAGIRSSVPAGWYKPAIVHMTIGRIKSMHYTPNDLRRIRAVLNRHNRERTLNVPITVKGVAFGQFRDQAQERFNASAIRLEGNTSLLLKRRREILEKLGIRATPPNLTRNVDRLVLLLALRDAVGMSNPLNPVKISGRVADGMLSERQQWLFDNANELFGSTSVEIMDTLQPDTERGQDALRRLVRFREFGINAFGITYSFTRPEASVRMKPNVFVSVENRKIKVEVYVRVHEAGNGKVSVFTLYSPDMEKIDGMSEDEAKVLVLGRGTLGFLSQIQEDKVLRKKLGMRFVPAVVEFPGDGILAHPGAVVDEYSRRLGNTLFVYRPSEEQAATLSAEGFNSLGLDREHGIIQEGKADLYRRGMLLADKTVAAEPMYRELEGAAQEGKLFPRDGTEESLRNYLLMLGAGVFRKSIEAMTLAFRNRMEIVPPSALRGQDHRRDPGTGKLTDLVVYLLRELKPAGIERMLLASLRKPGTASRKAGDEILIDWQALIGELVHKSLLPEKRGKELSVRLIAEENKRDRVHRREVEQREFEIAREIYGVLTEEKGYVEEFDAFKRDNRSWLEEYVQNTGTREQAEIHRLMQWLFARQLKQSVKSIAMNGGEAVFRVDVDGSYEDALDVVRHWYGFEFSGVHIAVRNSVIDRKGFGRFLDEVKSISEGQRSFKELLFIHLPAGTDGELVRMVRARGFTPLIEDTDTGPETGMAWGDGVVIRASDNKEKVEAAIKKAVGAGATWIVSRIGFLWGEEVDVEKEYAGRADFSGDGGGTGYRIPLAGDRRRKLGADFTESLRDDLKVEQWRYDQAYEMGVRYSRDRDVRDAGKRMLERVDKKVVGELFKAYEKLVEARKLDRPVPADYRTERFFDEAYRAFEFLGQEEGAAGAWRKISDYLENVRKGATDSRDKGRNEDVIRFNEQLFGFLRGLMEGIVELRYEKGYGAPDAAADPRALRSLLAAEFLVATGENAAGGIPSPVAERAGLEFQKRSNDNVIDALLYIRTLETSLKPGAEAEATMIRALRPYVRLVMETGTLPDSAFGALAGGKEHEEIRAWAISEMLMIYELLFNQRYFTNDIKKVIDTKMPVQVLRAIFSAA